MFNTALLPDGVRVIEEHLDAEGMEVVMPGELGAIVEGDGLSAVVGQRREEAGQGLSDGGGGLARGRTARRRREVRSWRVRTAWP